MKKSKKPTPAEPIIKPEEAASIPEEQAPEPSSPEAVVVRRGVKGAVVGGLLGGAGGAAVGGVFGLIGGALADDEKKSKW